MIIIRGMGSTGRMLRRRKSIMYSCNGWINPLYPWMKIHGPIEARDPWFFYVVLFFVSTAV